jgi:cobalt/nickel transport system permease protein
MHMADALISPAVGGTMWVATAATALYCAKKVREDDDPAKIPLMGVLGAFIFAAQMLNFSIPGTGSSGHLGGGLILAILLGPEAAFLTIASVLTVQALFFADGGLLALGCNIFNLGFFPAFVAYPIFKRIVGDRWSTGRVVAGSIVGAEIGATLGALAVVLETTISGVSALPFSVFAAAMIPIHLAIGVVEGLATSAVVLFVHRAQPDMLARAAERRRLAGLNLRGVLAGFAIVAMLSAAVLAWFASTSPDGLEWSIARVTGRPEVASAVTSPIQDAAATVQEKTAILPGYGAGASTEQDAEADRGGAGAPWPSAEGRTSVAGMVGALLTMLAALGVGYALKRRRVTRPAQQ